MLRIINAGRSGAKENMERDAKLLEELDPSGAPILHLYEWEMPSATYGYFVQPGQFLDLEAVQRRGVDLARRPTGGGIVFHIWDFAFSFLLPANHPAFSINTLENYCFVNKVVLEVMKEIFPSTEGILIPDPFMSKSEECSHFCMARPTQYDVVYQERKIAGAAQRRRKQGYLHQGTISLAPPDTFLLKDVLLSKESVLDAMVAYSFIPEMPMDKSRLLIQKLLPEKLESALSLSAR